MWGMLPASISQPCFLPRTPNALLGLLCDQKIRDDMGSSSLQHWDVVHLVHTASAIGWVMAGGLCWPLLSPPREGHDTCDLGAAHVPGMLPMTDGRGVMG